MGSAHRVDRPRLAALALLAACTGCTVSADECRGMSWYQLGYSDAWGEHPSQIARLTRLCARHGVEAARADYLEGWAVGESARERSKTKRVD